MRIVVFAAALGLTGCAAKSPPPPSAPSPLQGKAAPTFVRDTLDGRSVDTTKLAGRVTVLKFFAEYCEPCKRTLPAAQTLHRRYDEVAFIGISEDERRGDAVALVRQYGLTFPVVMDRGNVLSGRFRVAALPATFVLDREGTVAWVGGPGHDEDALEHAIASVLVP